jgi:hypothetical protein
VLILIEGYIVHRLYIHNTPDISGYALIGAAFSEAVKNLQMYCYWFAPLRPY